MSLRLLLFFVLFLFMSCKKAIENAQENAATQVLTTGQWRITSFIKATNDLSADYSGYRFQYKDNNTVDAIINGSTEKTGTWVTNLAAQTITIQFVNASPRLTTLNGTWRITKNSWTFVEADQTVNGEYLTLRIEK